MLELKRLSKEAIPAALAKVERYRLLNEPEQAESICRDILAADPENQQALVALVLSLTDQFVGGVSGRLNDAQAQLPRLKSEYDRAYYAGIIYERRARALLTRGSPGSGVIAYNWFREAMRWYEKAESLRPPANDDAVLRWNTCARFLRQNPDLAPVPEEKPEPIQLE